MGRLAVSGWQQIEVCPCPAPRPLRSSVARRTLSSLYTGERMGGASPGSRDRGRRAGLGPAPGLRGTWDRTRFLSPASLVLSAGPGRSAAGRTAKVGGGQAKGGGRQATARRCFLFNNAPWTCFPTPGPRWGHPAASRIPRCQRRVPCNLAILPLRG